MSEADVLSSDPKDFSEAKELVPFASNDLQYRIAHNAKQLFHS
jgi:hypothetical protein